MKYPISDAGSRLHGGKFTDGDPGLGILSSVDKAAHMNMVFDELIAVISGFGGVPSEAAFNQVYTVLNAAFAQRQPLDDTLTALAALTTAANQLIYSTGSNAFAMATLTAFARTLLAGADGAAMRTTLGAAAIDSPAFTGNPTVATQAAGNNSTRIANTAFVQAAIAAVINSSPAALDTLMELSAALGNDPNFATTMITALAGKANTAGYYASLVSGNSAAVGGYPAAQLWRTDQASFTGSTASWNRLTPDGFIEKGGIVVSTTDGPQQFFFPTAFPSECLSVDIIQYGFDSAYDIRVGSWNTGSFFADRENSIDSNRNLLYIAKGK